MFCDVLFIVKVMESTTYVRISGLMDEENVVYKHDWVWFAVKKNEMLFVRKWMGTGDIRWNKPVS